MKKDRNIVKYTADQLKAKRAESVTDFSKVDAISDEQLERLVAEDEHGIHPDWTRAKLILPHAKRSVHLRLEEDIVNFFKSSGRGHISRMQAVLKAYVNAHTPQAK